jgi:hypothetical protein
MLSHQYLLFLLGGLTAAQTSKTASPTCTGEDATGSLQGSVQITSTPVANGTSSCATTTSNCYYSYTSCSGTFSFFSK